MSEVISNFSQQLDLLRIQLFSAIESGLRVVESLGEDGQMYISSILSSPSVDVLTKSIKAQLGNISSIISDLKEIVQVYFHSTFFQHYYTLCVIGISRWNSSHLCAGCVGLFIGSAIGILIGLSYQPYIQFLIPMKAVVANNYKGIEGIAYIEETVMPIVTSPDEILVHVKAASLDIIDLQIASGYGRVLRYLFRKTYMSKKRDFPIILGRDCAGTVIEVGHNVRRLEVGDAVWLALPHWMTGTLSEYVVVKECYVSLKPKILDFEGSASIPYSGCIAWDAVCNKANINSISAYNRRVMVHCGHTAVGCIIVQLCRSFGAYVTVSSTEFARPLMTDLGAQHTLSLDDINTDTDQILPAHERFDVVFNTAGGTAYEFCRHLCKPDGLVITTSTSYLHSDTLGYKRAMLYSIWLKIQRVMIGRNVWKDTPINTAVLEELSSLVNSGKLRPVIDKIFPFEDTDRAFHYIYSANTIGKLVIRFGNTNNLNRRFWEHPNIFM